MHDRADDTDGEAKAEALLARSLLASGLVSEAANTAKRATALAADSQSLLTRFRVSITALRVQGLSGEPVSAQKQLAPIAAEAAERGLTALALEGRLALGEVELAAGNPAGRARLEALEKEADRQGMLFIARKAREAIAG